MSDIKKRLGRLLRSPINSLAGFVDVLRGVERVKEPTTSASAPADNDPKADITKFIVSNRTLQPAYRTTIAIYNALNGIINTPEELAAVPNAGLRESISEFPELNSTNSSPEKRASSRKFLAEKGLTYAQIAKEAAQEAHDAATKVGIPEADATVAHLPIVERRLEESLLPFYKNDLAGNRHYYIDEETPSTPAVEAPATPVAPAVVAIAAASVSQVAAETPTPVTQVSSPAPEEPTATATEEKPAAPASPAADNIPASEASAPTSPETDTPPAAEPPAPTSSTKLKLAKRKPQEPQAPTTDNSTATATASTGDVNQASTPVAPAAQTPPPAPAPAPSAETAKEAEKSKPEMMEIFVKPFGEKLLKDEKGLYFIGSPTIQPKRNEVGEVIPQKNAGNSIEHLRIYISQELDSDWTSRSQTITNVAAAQYNFADMYVRKIDDYTYELLGSGEAASDKARTVRFADEKGGTKAITYTNDATGSVWKHAELKTEQEIAKIYTDFYKADADSTKQILKDANTLEIFKNKAEDGKLSGLFDHHFGDAASSQKAIEEYYANNIEGKTFAELLEGKLPANSSGKTQFAHNIQKAINGQIDESLLQAMAEDKEVLMAVTAMRAFQRSVADHAIDRTLAVEFDDGKPVSVLEKVVNELHDKKDVLGNELFHVNTDGSRAGVFAKKRLDKQAIELAQMASHRMINRLAWLRNNEVDPAGNLDDLDKLIIKDNLKKQGKETNTADVSEKDLPTDPLEYLAKRADLLEDITTTDLDKVKERIEAGKPSSMSDVVYNVNASRIAGGVHPFGTNAPNNDSSSWKTTLAAFGYVVDEAFNNFLKAMEEMPMMI